MSDLSLTCTTKWGGTMPVPDADIKGWSSHYSSSGGGFGYLRYELPRTIGYSYPDVDYGLPVTLTKSGSKVLFDGMIRQIEETSSTDSGDRIMVTALGWAVVAQDDDVIAHYCDTRLNRWRPAKGPLPWPLIVGGYAPEKYTYGINNTGIFIHANNDTDFLAGDNHFGLRYYFHNPDSGWDPHSENATRIKATATILLGRGSLMETTVDLPVFEAQIDSVDDGTDTVVYKNDVGEDTVEVGDTLVNSTQDDSHTIATHTKATNTIVLSGSPDLSAWAVDDQLELEEGKIKYVHNTNETFVETGATLYNLDQGKQATVSTINETYNIIEVESRSNVQGWVVGDRLYVAGPAFWAQVNSITTNVITYKNDVGEGNIFNDWAVVNITKKHAAEISSHDTGANTITVTDANDIETWEEDDELQIYVSLLYAECDGAPSGTTVTYKNALGLWLVENDTGWHVWNETQDDYATVASWNTSSNQFDVTVSGDVSAWANDDVIRIFSPFGVGIYAGSTLLWPETDGREGYRMHLNTSIDVTDASPTDDFFEVILKCSISGTGDESTFVQMKDLRVYNNSTGPTRRFLFGEMADILLSHGLNGEKWDISGLYIDSALIEPASFEFMTPADILSWICAQGDGGDPPGRMVWGVRLNADRRLYMETPNLSWIQYVVRRVSRYDFSHGGSIDGSVQQAQGVYTDPFGEQQFTEVHISTDQKWGESNNNFIRRRIRLDNVDNLAAADEAILLYLEENSYPKKRSAYRVNEGAVFDPGGSVIPIDEIQASGGMIKIEDWRSATDIRDTEWGVSNDTTTDMIVAVEIDYPSRTATITPAGAKQSFETYMAVLARLAEATRG